MFEPFFPNPAPIIVNRLPMSNGKSWLRKMREEMDGDLPREKGGRDRRNGSGQGVDCGPQFARGVRISLALGRRQAGGEHAPRVLHASKFRQQLPVLEIAGDVIGMGFEKPSEVVESGVMVAFPHALHRQPIARESVLGVAGNERLELVPARTRVVAHTNVVLYRVRRLPHGEACNR